MCVEDLGQGWRVGGVGQKCHWSHRYKMTQTESLIKNN